MAMAPEQIGIGIRRHFTRVGEHPYDTVAWERRDARIPNYKTGGDAFFQAGVEFPRPWSHNSTNIVAQKYFRGQLDTPGRESSLRQVVDRVADTITTWGMRDGYFVDDAETEAFRDELKYLLVHQRAAFNSPVWFNIGVRGVPAQASACFILAVDDTMASILNWYVEEGTIFKGGSGSGINLSNIRSSREPLAGGGTASGPVSFMRGADASAGTIKCLHADTDLVTDHGVVPIRALSAGWRVLTRHGFRTVSAVHDNGQRPLVRVRTGLGDEIVCTPEHRFRVRNRAGESWREAGQLTADDYVIADLGHTDHGVAQHLVEEEESATGETFPVELDEAFAVWLGWAHGAGRLRPVSHSGALAVHTEGGDPGLRERFRAFTQSVFGTQAAAQVARGGEAAPAAICPPRVARFLQANGLWRSGERGVGVPRLVRSSPAGVRAAFLAGLFESDGQVEHGCPTLWTGHRALALDVHRLLGSIGIPSKITPARPAMKGENGDENSGEVDLSAVVDTDEADPAGAVPTNGPGLVPGRPRWQVRVIGGEGVRRFAKLVGFVSEGKARLLEASLDQPETFQPSWFFPHVDAELDRLGFEAGPALRAAISIYRQDANPYGMSLGRAEAILEAHGGALDGPLVRFAQGDELYVPVTVEPAEAGPTFDLTVDDGHEYLVQRIVTHNSGGKTRRAAKMVVLNADHPDVEQFIWCKAVEERKARALAAAGFDMDLDGADSHSIQYQNANNSVRVSDEFMQAAVDGRDWDLRAVRGGESLRTMPAQDLLRQICEAAWECADPGIQFDGTINRWHTVPNTGRINASNPCFPGSARVHTDKGLIRFDDLIDRVRLGETFGVYTHDATNPDAPAERLEITTPEAVMITGWNEIVKLRFSNGMELRCTPNHRIFTVNRGYVEASALTDGDEVKVLDLPAPAVKADWRVPVSAELRDYVVKGDRSRQLRLPDKWTPEFSHYLGWLVGDGCISGNAVTTVYGSRDDQEDVLPRHQQLIAWMNGDRFPKPSVQGNGTIQLRQGPRAIAKFLIALGIGRAKAAEKTVPWAIEQAPPEIVAAFLQGLFDADGCVYEGEKSRYVGLGSASRELLKGVQRLLSTFGILSRLYRTRTTPEPAFAHVGKDGVERSYTSNAMYDLRISSRAIERFASHVGFSVQAKHDRLGTLLVNHDFYAMPYPVRLIERWEDGVELTYNLSEPRNHSYIVDNVIVRNCSEYVSLDNSACNLASLNLLKFLGDDGTFDVDGFKAAVEVIFTAQEILVGNADYPTKKIGDTTRRFRQLGIGYANLGALLMAQGLPYDSDEGRAWAAAITSLMTGHAYATSARTAGRMGPFAGYTKNREPMLNVLRMHRAELERVDRTLAPAAVVEAARGAWDEAVELGEAYGVRNSQASVLAPTGCLVGGSLVNTAGGLVRLGTLGDPDGPQWQPLGLDVLTHEGPRRARDFYVNGLAPVAEIVTVSGYRITGTTTHRVKAVDDSGRWEWRRLSDLRPGDRVPLAVGQFVGDRQAVPLAALPRVVRATGERTVRVPKAMSPELAELLGYFMGRGSRSPEGLRFRTEDPDVAGHVERLVKALFGAEAIAPAGRTPGTVEVESMRLARWWSVCGFARTSEAGAADRVVDGDAEPLDVPDAVLETNCPDTYRAFLRGLYEAVGTTVGGVPALTLPSLSAAVEIQTLLLALGYVTVRKAGARAVQSVRLAERTVNARWADEIGFISAGKARSLEAAPAGRAPSPDQIPVRRDLLEALRGLSAAARKAALAEHRRLGGLTRRTAESLRDATGDAELARLVGFFYDRVAAARLAGEELTYDLSVPDYVAYVANGFVSHNTIGLMMDCDTTGVEPDLALTKAKKLVGGGTMFIVNQTVPRALRRLGYREDQVEAIVAHIDEHKTIVGAPDVTPGHLDVFACAMGDNTIHYMGHVNMMAAVQPFVSGAISKCVVGETLLSTADGLVRIGDLHRGEAPDTFRDEMVEVASLGGTHKTNAFYYGGARPVREVRLRDGRSVTGTPNHRLLVAGHDGLTWRRLDEIAPGEQVALRYGADLWSAIPARLPHIAGYSGPGEMSEDIAFLLGAHAACGTTEEGRARLAISAPARPALEHLAGIWSSTFGLQARLSRAGAQRPYVSVSSPPTVDLFGALDVEERIPGAVLTSPRTMVLAYLEGLFLAARVSRSGGTLTVSLEVRSPGLAADLRAVLTNLGLVHGAGADPTTVEMRGDAARCVLDLVPLSDLTTAATARELCRLPDAAGATYGGGGSGDHVPGLTPRELYLLVPAAHRNRFAFLRDERSRHVSRRVLERVAALSHTELPDWLATVVADGLRFSPVDSVADAGEREVYDVSVPLVHAFVANGIVNHNTINMPEDATVADVTDLHVEAWRLGLKAIAIYRDNCKVGQPLSTQKKAGAATPGAPLVREVERVIETIVLQEPVRKKLPRRRNSKTFSFRVADCHGYVTVGEYDDGRPGEIFLRVAKQGSTLAGVMDAFAISVSHGLQYGVPFKAFAEMFINMRFEPAGITDDPEIRLASSLVDYIFRRLAVEYLPYEERVDLGIRTVGERTQPTLPGVEEATIRREPSSELTPPTLDQPPRPDPAPVVALPSPAPPPASSSPHALGIPESTRRADAPYCYACGMEMQRAGSCYVCGSCGATSGCS